MGATKATHKLMIAITISLLVPLLHLGRALEEPKRQDLVQMVRIWRTDRTTMMMELLARSSRRLTSFTTMVNTTNVLSYSLPSGLYASSSPCFSYQCFSWCPKNWHLGSISGWSSFWSHLGCKRASRSSLSISFFADPNHATTSQLASSWHLFFAASLQSPRKASSAHSYF